MNTVKLLRLLIEAEEEKKEPEEDESKKDPSDPKGKKGDKLSGDESGEKKQQLKQQYKDAAGKLRRAFQASTVSDFVAKFKPIATDHKVQAILSAGQKDKQGPEDEVVTYKEGDLSVKSLTPTQNEIGFDQSIENILTDKYGSLKSILEGNADVGGPIVTYNSQYVIDGHHRWSQVYAGNPDAKMKVVDIKGKLKPEDILKIVHAAIAVRLKRVPSSNPKGINILNGITEEQVLESTNKNISDKAKKIWAENGQKTNEEVAKYINKNLQSLITNNRPIPGAPGRKDMPQTDQGEKDSIPKLDLLAKGIVNFNNPVSTDVDKKLTEERKRFQKIAGIKK
jgi:hypothetical protein